jgi:hypothetical protein
MSNDPDDESTESQQESEQEPADSDQPAAQSDKQPTEQSDQTTEEPTDDNQPADQSQEQPAEADQPLAEAEAQPTDSNADQSGEADQARDQSGTQPEAGSGGSEAGADQSAATGGLSAKRQAMLDLIDKWMPTSLNSPRVPEGETQDLMAKAGWTKARGQQSKQEKDADGHPVTSCGDILAAMLRLWGSNFVGAFMIRDQDAKGRTPGAKGLGYYVEADSTQSPQPGDIIVLRNGVGKGSAGTVGHVGILVEAGESEWRTADGGGGALPDQTASVTTRTVSFENNIPILKSPTDLKEKQLDGWVDLDKLEQTG